MSANSFRSVFMVASCAAAALGCYLVSLRVASERAALEQVETEIVLAERDIRLLQTEIGTRGRLAQLERWNVKVLALSAPSVDQFVGGSFELARMVTPQRKIDLDAPVVLASAPAPAPKPQVETSGTDAEADQPASRNELLHTASLKRTLPATVKPADEKTAPARPIERSKAPEADAKPAAPKAKPKAPAPKTGEKKLASLTPPSAPKKTVDKPVVAPAKPVTKQAKLAKSDPLAPLPASKAKTAAKPAKDSRQTP